MIYIIEGLDNCLKDTVIRELKKHLNEHTHVLHYSKPPELDCCIQEYQKENFKDMFKLMADNIDTNFILNRSHIGEHVYSPIYRKYSGAYVFELEEEFLKRVKQEYVKLVVLYDTNMTHLQARDDGNSFSKNKEANLKNEIALFQEAAIKSNFKHKVLLDLDLYKEEKCYKVDIDKLMKRIINQHGIQLSFSFD